MRLVRMRHRALQHIGVAHDAKAQRDRKRPVNDRRLAFAVAANIAGP
jgi:hypothetical protein